MSGNQKLKKSDGEKEKGWKRDTLKKKTERDTKLEREWQGNNNWNRVAERKVKVLEGEKNKVGIKIEG